MIPIPRFVFVRLLATAVAAALCLPAIAAAFDFDDVSRQAQALALAPYQEPPPLPPALSALSYDQYRGIRYRAARSLWREPGLPFNVQFFPVGRGFTRALKVYEVVDGEPRPLKLPPDAFTDENHALPAHHDAAAAIAGLRVQYALNTPGVLDEVITFLGASYFRALGSGQRYGVSARALAVDTVGGGGEEFPALTSFWLERPAPGAASLTIYALLDGPRVAGAYRFIIRPGADTVVDVQARLWQRGPVAMLGIAPLSSMFLGGENEPLAGDYRPEVHDSDGLQIETAAGEWLWRPLINPAGTFVSSFAMATPRGFGLMQRDRRFTSYEDLEARYELRPSVWIEPLGDWGAGRVELLQFHTPDETHDNIAAYWVPAATPPVGQPLTLAWRLHWLGAHPVLPPGAHVVQTRVGQGFHDATVPAVPLQFHIDFAGPSLDALPSGAPVDAVVSGNARKSRAVVYPNPAIGGWRVTLDVDRGDRKQPLELRLFLRSGERVLSETWSYALAPE